MLLLRAEFGQRLASVSAPNGPSDPIAWPSGLIVPHILVDTSESNSVLNNSLVPNSFITKHGFVLAHLQTRRPLRSVLHFGLGRKWHEIGQSNYGQANESQEHRWLEIIPIRFSTVAYSDQDVWYDEPAGPGYVNCWLFGPKHKNSESCHTSRNFRGRTPRL